MPDKVTATVEAPTKEQQTISAPFQLPVRYDKEEMCILDAAGVTVIDTGRWLSQDFEPKMVKRAEFVVKVLNGDIAVIRDYRNGEILLSEVNYIK